MQNRTPLLVCALSLLLPAGARAADVELRPGDDIGTLTAALGPGDTVTFQDGVYSIESGLDFRGVGTAEMPILVTAAEGASPIIEATGGTAVIDVLESSHLTVRGLTLRGPAASWEEDNLFGLRVIDSSHITVEDCVIQQVARTGVSIGGNSEAIDVVRNHIHGLGGYGIYAGCSDASCWTLDSVFADNWIHDLADEGARGIQLANGGQGVLIEDNVIYGVGQRGIQLGSAELGTPNTVAGNVIWQVGDVGLLIDGAARVRNNIVFDVLGNGLRSSQNGQGTLGDLVISSNTFLRTGDNAVELYDWGEASDMVFANNVLSNPTGRAFETDDSGLGAAYVAGNVMTGWVQDLDPTLGHFVSGRGDADFADVDNWNFYPAQGSWLVDAGSAEGQAWVPELDFNGLAREGDAPDAGAYERIAGDNPGWAIREGFKELSDGVIPEEVVSGCSCAEPAADEQLSALMGLLPLLLWVRRRRAGQRG